MGTAPFQPVAHRRSEMIRDSWAALLPLTILLFLPAVIAPYSLWALLGPAVALSLLLAYGTSIAVAVKPPRDEPRPLALRLVVAWLHIVQPFARTWGRLRIRSAPEEREDRREWTGDRYEWLLELKRDLRTRRCKVRPGKPHDSFDLAASVGPMVTCRIWTAVAWNWLPRTRTELRPRIAAIAGLLLGAVVMPVWFWAGIGILAAVGLISVVEAMLVSRAVRSALRKTVRHAHEEGS